MHRVRSVRQRVTAKSMVVAGLVALTLYAALVALIRAQYVSWLTGELAGTAHTTAAEVSSGGLVTVPDRELVQVQNDRGQVIAASPAMRGMPSLHVRRPPDEERLEQRVCEPGRCYVVVSVRMTGAAQQPVTVHSLAREPGLFPRPGLAALLALGIPVGAGLTGLVGWWVAGRRLRPVERLSAELNAMKVGDLHPRVSLPGRRDEYYGLALAVNAALDRMEEAVRRQHRFLCDASHDLRSPITGMRAELETALLDLEGADLRDTLAKVLKNTDRLQDIVTGLLALARRDAGMAPCDEPVDLAEVAEREVGWTPRRITAELDTEAGVLVRASGVDIGRVLTNLLDNADRYAESRVAVTVRRRAGEAVVEVFNDGEPIAPGDRERIFERFTRLHRPTGSDSSGAGLGLAISRGIAESLGGTLAAAPCERGALFVLTLPLA